MQRTTDVDHWKEQYTWETERLIAALGEMTDSEIVQRMEHVGTTSVCRSPWAAMRRHRPGRVAFPS